MGIVRLIRRVLAKADGFLAHLDSRPYSPADTPSGRRKDEIQDFILTLDQPSEDARAYLIMHLKRISRTLSLVPEPATTRRALELGSYMQMTPALKCILGYQEVRGAYYGSPGLVDTKVSTIGGREILRCEIDVFDAEKDAFPYPEQHFDLVLACEIIEFPARPDAHVDRDPACPY